MERELARGKTVLEGVWSGVGGFPEIGLFPDFSRTVSYHNEILTARFKSRQLHRRIDQQAGAIAALATSPSHS